jgi:HD-like signal output (HDOD) protein
VQAENSLLEIINTHLSSDKIKLPVFSPIAMRIQKEIASEDPDVILIEKLICNDVALTGSVLKVANSSFYKGLTQVATIRNAIVRLGVNEISNMVMLITHENNFRSKDPFLHDFMRRLWRHSLGCALGAHWLCKHCGVQIIAHEAFVGGLLHDLGKLFILRVIDQIKDSGEMNLQLSEQLVNEIMNSLHPEYGYSLIKQWNLPEKYCRVARDHHAEEFNQKDFLLILVRMANMACNKMGIGLNTDPSLILMVAPEAQLLHLSDIDIANLEIRLEDSQVSGNKG